MDTGTRRIWRVVIVPQKQPELNLSLTLLIKRPFFPSYQYVLVLGQVLASQLTDRPHSTRRLASPANKPHWTFVSCES
jgi:hypothetical protein